MRKRLIGGVTAICIAVILVCNMFITASASVTAAALSVGVSLLLGALLNQMTGGQGYDFTDAFQDAVTVYPNLEENFENSEVYPIEKIEIDKSKVDIPDDYRFSTFGGTSADKTLIEIEKAINEGLESGNVEINVDEQGNVSMPTESYCTIVDTIYSNFGVITSNNGLKRSQTVYNFISPYIDSVCYGEYSYSTSRALYAVPFVITSDGLFCPNMRFSVSNAFTQVETWNSWFGSTVINNYPCCTDYNWSSDVLDYNTTVYFNDNFTVFTVESVCLKDSHFDKTDFDLSNRKSSDGKPITYSISGIPIDYTNIMKSGFFFIGNTVNDYNNFLSAYKTGEISYKVENQSISLTDVEKTILDMGLSGIGSGATAGTVSVNSTTKEIVVTNEVTQEAEKVIEQPKVSDIDLPDSDTIIDKFPFSLPFDIYRLLTIFVADEKEPIFEVPIQTSFGWSGIDVNVDESFTLDFTQFRINGIDIVQCLVRTSFNVLFIAFLIKITYKMIHK